VLVCNTSTLHEADRPKGLKRMIAEKPATNIIFQVVYR
jgi:hypothetical protein